MPTVITKEEIIALTKGLDVLSAIEKGFIAYSTNKAIVPPVAELLYENPKGETHIKYGYIKDEDYSVIKVASGFYGNSKLGISSSQGLMLLFSQKTGETKGVLLDDGYLTDVRTAAAGAVVAKYLAPKNIKAIGIIGTGIQARLQLKYLQEITSCKTVWVWGRNIDHVQHYKDELSSDFDIHIAKTPTELAHYCNMIITTTPSETALLRTQDIQPGTHITAVGSDTPEKQELENTLLYKADIVVADSILQSNSRGEIFRAIKEKILPPHKVIELGNIIQNRSLQRQNDNQITIADLTGVAVQDIMIATSVYRKYKNLNQ